MPGADDKPNGAEDENKEGEEVVDGHVPSLDEVHERTVDKIEEDDADAGDGEGEGADEDADKPKPADKAKTGEEGADEDEDGADKPKPAEEDKPEPKPAEPAKTEDKPAEAVVDTDIEKAGPDKVAIKGFDGKTYHFNNIDEVPDDFEPENYKTLMKGLDALQNKKAKDDAIAFQADKDASDAVVATRQKELEASWESDIDSLTKAKVLPADEKERKATVDAVYDYMEAELKEGRIVENWATAYKAMMYDKGQADAAKADEDAKDNKKSRGGVVQSGGTAAPASPKTRVITGPPPGVTLDQVHEKALGSL